MLLGIDINCFYFGVCISLCFTSVSYDSIVYAIYCVARPWNVNTWFHVVQIAAIVLSRQCRQKFDTSRFVFAHRSCWYLLAECGQILSVFTARCTLVQSAVLRSHVVCLSVCLSVSPSVTLVDCDHIGWNSSKITSPLVSLGRSLFATPTWQVCSKGNTPKFGPKVTHPLLIWASETFDR